MSSSVGISNTSLQFQYNRPQIESILPFPGQSGSNITLLGRNFLNTSALPLSVRIQPLNVLCTRFILVSSGNATCTLPNNLPQSNYTIEPNLNGQPMSSFENYTIVPVTPVITSVSQNNKNISYSEPISMVITPHISAPVEAFLHYSVNASFGLTLPMTSCTVSTTTLLRCFLPTTIPFSGTYNISAKSGSSEGPLFQGYTFLPPVVTQITPLNGSTGGNELISIFGHNFGEGAVNYFPTLVTIGGNPCTSVTRVNDSLITCITPMVRNMSTNARALV